MFATKISSNVFRVRGSGITATVNAKTAADAILVGLRTAVVFHE